MARNAAPRPPPVGASAGSAWAGEPASAAAQAVTLLYQVNALGLVRLAYVMIGDRGTAEDIVQEAFSGLYRRWAKLTDPDKAVSYLRSSVLNACRSELRRRRPFLAGGLAGESAAPRQEQACGETAALREEDRSVMMAALRRLPHRQREVLVLRFYLGMSETQIAAQMGIGKSTVRSAAHRALAALGRMLQEAE